MPIMLNTIFQSEGFELSEVRLLRHQPRLVAHKKTKRKNMMNEEAVLKMLKEKHNVLIGERTTEELLFEVKRRLGDIKFSVNARSLKDGSKQTVEVSALDFL